MARIYTAKIHYDGPDKLVAESGAEIEVKAGATLTLTGATIAGVVTAPVIDTLVSTSATSALSAKQGKALKTLIDTAVTVTPNASGAVDLNILLAALQTAGKISVATSTAATELAKITDVGVKTVPFGTANTKAGVEAAMLVLANALDAAGYTVTIAAGSTYNTGTKAWTGKFVETNNATPLNTVTDAADRSFTVIIAES